MGTQDMVCVDYRLIDCACILLIALFPRAVVPNPLPVRRGGDPTTSIQEVIHVTKCSASD